MTGDFSQQLRRIRLVVSDMDGTLLDAKHQLPEVTRNLIVHLEQTSKVHFALGTGRPRVSAAKPFSTEFGFHGRPGVFLNGAQVHGLQGELVRQSLVPTAAVQAVAETLKCHRPHRLTVVLCCGDETYLLASEDDNAFSYYLAAKYSDPVPRVLAGGAESVAVNMISVLCRDASEVKSWLMPELHKVADEFGLMLVNSLPNLVSLLPPQTNKAEGVRLLAETLGVDLADVAVVGDAHNDLEMLKVAGLAVAVENAMDELKHVAHLIVNHHNHDTLPGVAQLLQLIIDAKNLNTTNAL